MISRKNSRVLRGNTNDLEINFRQSFSRRKISISRVTISNFLHNNLHSRQFYAILINVKGGNCWQALTCSFDHWILPMQRAEFLHAVFAPNISSESFNWYPPVAWISFSICFHRAWWAGELKLLMEVNYVISLKLQHVPSWSTLINDSIKYGNQILITTHC